MQYNISIALSLTNSADEFLKDQKSKSTFSFHFDAVVHTYRAKDCNKSNYSQNILPVPCSYINRVLKRKPVSKEGGGAFAHRDQKFPLLLSVDLLQKTINYTLQNKNTTTVTKVCH